MRICPELTSSGSQLALHRTIQGVDGLLGGHETELSSPGRGAGAIAPRRAARADADDAAGLRRVARLPRPVNAAGTRNPDLEYPSQFPIKTKKDELAR